LVKRKKRRPLRATLQNDQLAGSIENQSSREAAQRVHSLRQVFSAFDDGTWPVTCEILDECVRLTDAAASWTLRAEFEMVCAS
jgi:hypothetical protein